MTLPPEVLTSEQMRKADRIAIHEMKIPSLTLMENAGRAVARESIRFLKSLRAQRRAPVGVVCGKGNNGGDGLVVARLLSMAGCRIRVFLLSTDFSPDAYVQFRRLPPGAKKIVVSAPALWKKHLCDLYDCSLVVDAIFGTGMSGNLKAPYPRVIDDINNLGRPVIAVDIPSGIDATTGAALGTAICADRTVTFVRAKIGHLLPPGTAYTGALTVADIGIPGSAIDTARPHTFLENRLMMSALLPSRPMHSHKGAYGRSVILAGSRGMIGAAILATEAAMRIGSGLTTLVVPDAMYSIAARKLPPEGMCRPAPDNGHGVFTRNALASTRRLIEQANAVLIGPGIGRDPKTIRWLVDVLKMIPAPAHVVLDADALFALAVSPSVWKFLARHDAVITPHAGEMARLIGKTRAAVESDFCGAARTFSHDRRVTVVLKGSRTVIASPDRTAYINVTGNSALAKGGSGDVLAGMMCGLCAQGMSAIHAARLAVYLHGRAADLAVSSGRNKRTVLASDLFTFFDPAINELELSQ